MNNFKKSDDFEKCSKCKPEDHEWIFCRCEERNIRIAKQLRGHGESPWSKGKFSSSVGNK